MRLNTVSTKNNIFINVTSTIPLQHLTPKAVEYTLDFNHLMGRFSF